MSYPSTRLGGQAFNHSPSTSSEAEYERLRQLARDEHGKYQRCAAKSRQAYESGDGAGAHQLSEEGKEHARKADDYNKQASEYIFRENNAVGKVAGDTIDLHGQYVEEAEAILEQRIRYAQQTGQSHLHVIVGKGNHSPDHIQKIRPRVEQICQELGLRYEIEHNEGRMYIDLTGGQPQGMPAYQQPQPGQYDQNMHGQPHYETAYPMGGAPTYGYHQQQPQQGGGYPAQQQQQYQSSGGYPGPQQGQPQQQMETEEQMEADCLQSLKKCCIMM